MCESGGGGPGVGRPSLTVLNNYGLCGRKATLNLTSSGDHPSHLFVSESFFLSFMVLYVHRNHKA